MNSARFQKGNALLLLTFTLLGILFVFAAYLVRNNRLANTGQTNSMNMTTMHESENNGQGLVGRYFNTPDFSGPSFTQTDLQLAFDFDIDVSEKITSNMFSARWLGLIIPPKSEEYTFYANTTGGVKVTVNEKVVINQLTNNSQNEFKGTMQMEANKGYPITVEYSGTRGKLELWWSSPTTPKQLIPQTSLFTGSDDIIQAP